MPVVIIGSYALDPLKNNSKDLDIIAPFSDGFSFCRKYHNQSSMKRYKQDLYVHFPKDKNKLIIEHLIPDDNSNKKIYDYSLENGIKSEFNGEEVLLSPPLILYAIKLSHRFKKTTVLEFKKTMRDIKYIESKYDLNFEKLKSNKVVFDIFKMREKEVLSYSHPILNKTKKDFFTDDVTYTYDHDSIHEAIKNLDKPAYQYFKPEDNDVLCSKEMFLSLDKNIQILSVVEESCVLALERAIIPFNDNPTEIYLLDKFQYALQKVCTSITSGWFREYAYLNYDEVVKMYDEKYYDKFLNGIKTGIIKKYIP